MPAIHDAPVTLRTGALSVLFRNHSRRRSRTEAAEHQQQPAGQEQCRQAGTGFRPGIGQHVIHDRAAAPRQQRVPAQHPADHRKAATPPEQVVIHQYDTEQRGEHRADQ